MVQSVAADKEAIGYAGLGYVERSVKALAVNGCYPDPTTVKSGKYPLSRVLFLFTRNGLSEFGKRFLEFVFGPEGQHVVNQEGFVPVRWYDDTPKQ